MIVGKQTNFSMYPGSKYRRLFNGNNDLVSPSCSFSLLSREKEGRRGAIVVVVVKGEGEGEGIVLLMLLISRPEYGVDESALGKYCIVDNVGVGVGRCGGSEKGGAKSIGVNDVDVTGG